MHQFGSKSMIHVMQHVLEQSPDFDVFSADAVKAFYNLNRDLASIKFKEKCPGTPASVAFLEDLATLVHPYPKTKTKIKYSACRAGFAGRQKKLSKSKKRLFLDISRTIEIWGK